MNVERMEPIRPSPRCIDNLRSDLKEHQVDPKLAQKMEEFKIAILTIDPGRDSPRTGIRSAKVQHVCVIIFSCQPRSLRLFNGCALVKKMLQKLPCINRLLKEVEETCKQKYDARRRFPFSMLCASVVCRSEMSPSFTFCHVDMLRHLPKTRHNSHIGRCSLFLQDVVQLLHAPCPFSSRTSLFTNAFGVSGIVWNLCWRDAVV